MLKHSSKQVEGLFNYYYLLAKANGHWGKRIFKVIISAAKEDWDKYELNQEIEKINTSRRNSNSFNEKKESLQIYKSPVIPILIKDWIGLTHLIPYLSVPFISFIFYIPLYLIGNMDQEKRLYLERSEKFIITKEFVDQTQSSLPSKDVTPPGPPRNLKIF